MEPEIAAIDEQIKQTETVKKLQERDEEIVKDLEGLKEGQKDINEKVDIGFEKGRIRMDGIEEEVKKVTQMLVDSGKKRDEQHSAVLSKITDNEIAKLERKLADREKLIETKDSKVWDVIKGGIIAIFSIIATIVAFSYLVGIGLK